MADVMTKASATPLFVDLDGTLIKTDSMLEAIVSLLREKPLSVFLMLSWLCRGRATFKNELAQRVNLNINSFPTNPEFEAYLAMEQAKGREMILISASNQRVVDLALERFTFFKEGWGSDSSVNLKAEAKLQQIQKLSANNAFAYAGDSNSDLPIWHEAQEIVLVNCHNLVSRRAKLDAHINARVIELDKPSSRKTNFYKAMRPHQWLKNTLVFLPLILSHQIGQTNLLVASIIAFISFSLCASSVYLVNDMLDINNDRSHRSKMNRAFAAGSLPLRYGFVGAPLLFFSGIILASVVNSDFVAMLLLYWLITCLYSLFLKKLFLADVVTLALLFTMRVIAGSAAIGVETTDWLMAFIGFLFLSLALLKRVIELIDLKSRGKLKSEGRSYTIDQLPLLTTMGIMASAASVIIFAIYINAPSTLQLYSSPTTLWGICPLFLAMLGRIWVAALSGKLNEDPVLFAIEDHPSQAMMLVSGIFLWLAI